jgi:hypothetical protein
VRRLLLTLCRSRRDPLLCLSLPKVKRPFAGHRRAGAVDVSHRYPLARKLPVRYRPTSGRTIGLPSNVGIMCGQLKAVGLRSIQ